MSAWGAKRARVASPLSISGREGRLDRHSVSLLGPGRQQCHFFSNPLFCSLATGKLGGMVKSFIFSVSVRGTWGAEHAITSRLLSSCRSLEMSIYRAIDISSIVCRRSSSVYHQSSINSSLFFTAMSTLATGRRLLPVGNAPVWCCGGAS